MAGKGINITITADPATTKAALELVRRELKDTGSEGKRVGEEIAQGMNLIKSSLAAIGIGLGLREIISELREVVSSSLDFGEQMTKASQRTGLAVDTLSTLHYAAAVTNSDFDGLINGLGKMNKLIGEAADGNKKAAGFVQGLGLDAKDLAGRTDGAEIAFHRFIDRLAATENPIRRNQFAMELLGKAGSAQIPMLIDVAQHWDEFKDRATAAGVQLNAETAKSLEDTNRRLADMKQRATGAGLELTEGLTPAISAMLGVLAGGKSTTQAMIDLGQTLGRTFAFMGMAAYGLASGTETAFAATEALLSLAPGGGGLVAQAARDLAAAEEFNKKALGMRDIALGNAKAQPGIPGGEGGSGGGVGGFEGNLHTGPLKSDNAIAVAGAALLEEQGKLAADVQKHLDQAKLAELETQHKLLLLTDAEYYKEKLSLQEDALAVEEDALRGRLKTLSDLNDRQKGDTLLKRDKGGKSAEELKTQREMVQVQEQLNALAARHLELQSGEVAEQDASNRKAELAGLEMMANLERERNAGLTAQIALLRRKAELEAQRITAEGGTPADAEAARSLGEIAVRQLQIADVGRQINDIEAEHKARIDDINDAIAKDPRLKLKGEKAIDADRKQEADQIRDLVAQYDALAQTLGGEALVKAHELQAELHKLNNPDNRQDAEFGKTLAEGIEGMSRRMADAAASGKESFHSMAKSIEMDLLDLAIKLAEVKWLTPALSGANGVKAPWDEKSGVLTQTPSLGAPRPSLAASAESSVSSFLGRVGGLFGGKGAGSGDGIKIIVQGETSAPVMAASATASGGSQGLQDMVVNLWLKDVHEGGPAAMLFRGLL